MSNPIQVFNFKNHQVRTAIIGGNPWWVAKDVCEVLGISKYRDAMSRLDDDERGSVLVDTPGGKQDMAIVNEPGLYSLILRSRKTEAKDFKRWVTHEVLPAIRKTGSYSVASPKPRARRSTLPPAAQRFNEAHKIFTNVMKLQKPMKLTWEHARDMAVQQVRNETGLDLSKVFDLSQVQEPVKRVKTVKPTDSLPAPVPVALPAPERPKDRYLSPTDLGQMTNKKLSAKKINELLEQYGFQTRINGKWVGALEHSEHWTVVNAYTPTGSVIQNLRWYPSVLHALKAKIQEAKQTA